MNVTRRALVGASLAMSILPRASRAAGKPQDSDMTDCSTVELRQYTLFGGKRDRLITLFEQAFVEPQNALGAQVLGSFTDLDDPDRFVWLRGFADMAARGAALPAFYSGPAWQANRNAANATMRDSDNVLLLRLLSGSLMPRPATTPGSYSIDIHYLCGVGTDRFAAFFDATLRPLLATAGILPCATLATEAAPNNFPALPVRERESVFVHVATHASRAELAEKERALAKLGGWRDAAPEDLIPTLMRKPERLRLQPTARSALS